MKYRDLAERPMGPRRKLRRFFLEDFFQDVRSALNQLRKRPTFSLTVILTLAVTMAGTSAMFSIYDSLFIKPLPFPQGEQLVDLGEAAPSWNIDYGKLDPVDFYAWQEQNQTFQDMAVWDDSDFNLALANQSERVIGARALVPKFW